MRPPEHLAYTPAQRALRAELRAYFAALVTADVRRDLRLPDTSTATSRTLHLKLGADGWLGVGWPREYGGRGLTPVEQFIFFDEAARAGCPLPLVALNTVGPTLMRYGSPEQKDLILPGILSGEIDVAAGYSEPGAGTDLASLATRAVRTEDGAAYVVNGQKIFTTHGDSAEYVWLACRTDPDAPKHKGISILLVDTRSPGFEATKIHTIASHYTTATYYHDVRVPAAMRVGAENEGWKLITTQLNHERVALAAVAQGVIRSFAKVQRWAAETPAADGKRVLDLPWVKATMARAYVRISGLRLLNGQMVAALQKDQTGGHLSPADASAAKVHGTETHIEALAELLQVLGAGGILKDGSPGALLAGDLEFLYRYAVTNTFGGGANEIQREIIAMTGLAMPRVRR
ncbi:MAG: acyl-CoA dehydrogenase [Catenulispora sp.]|nr:acyl-CoA dehydrogenase [Catenulispora sp.]